MNHSSPLHKKLYSTDTFETQTPSLHILLVVHRRVDEILITNIIRETRHRLHIVDSPDMIRHSLDLQPFDMALICDNNQKRANQAVRVLSTHPKGSHLLLIGINPENDIEKYAKSFDFKTLCTLHAPITSHKLSSILNYHASKLKNDHKD
jgi:hypothetical protein